MKSLEEIKLLLEDILSKINYDDIVYEDVHLTSLKHLYNTDPKQFMKRFQLIFKFDTLSDCDKYDLSTNPLTTYETCNNCGEFIKLYFDGKRIYSENKECFSKQIYSVDINVQSGKLLLIDWIAHGLEIVKVEDANVNYLKERFKLSKNYEDNNIMHFFVGDTSPVVMKKENEIIIGQLGYYEDENGEDVEFFYDDTFELKGSICTDLWWATGIDLELYKKLLKETFGDNWQDDKVSKCLEETIIVDIKPGTYTCTTFFETCDRDNYEKPQTYIKIEPKKENN